MVPQMATYVESPPKSIQVLDQGVEGIAGRQMGVAGDHREGGMSNDLLHGDRVHSLRQHVGDEAVPEEVRVDTLGDTSVDCRILDQLLYPVSGPGGVATCAGDMGEDGPV